MVPAVGSCKSPAGARRLRDLLVLSCQVSDAVAHFAEAVRWTPRPRAAYLGLNETERSSRQMRTS